MALIQCEFFSEVLSKSMAMNVILPQKSFLSREHGIGRDKYPTLFLLHGFSDNHTIWARNTSIVRYVSGLDLAVVMPAADNSYYTDMKSGGDYWTYLTEEVPFVARSLFPLSDKRADNFVAGNSMGGFGALKWGLNKPEMFSAIASLSGVTDMVYHLKTIDGDKKRVLSFIFGEKNVRETANDILWKLNQVGNTEAVKPKLYEACGTEDFLYEHNRRFLKVCKGTGFDLTTDFGPGDHDWKYWDKQIQDVLEWLPIPKV